MLDTHHQHKDATTSTTSNSDSDGNSEDNNHNRSMTKIDDDEHGQTPKSHRGHDPSSLRALLVDAGATTDAGRAKPLLHLSPHRDTSSGHTSLGNSNANSRSFTSSRSRRRSSCETDLTDGGFKTFTEVNSISPAQPSHELKIEHNPSVLTETRQMHTARRLAEISENSLDFSQVGLISRQKEKRVLEHALKQILRATPSAANNRTTAPKASSFGGESMVDSSDEELGTSMEQPEHPRQSHRPQRLRPAGGTGDSSRPTVRCLVSIAGYSGTGKSALAETLRPKCEANNVFFITGKFDLKQMDEPYSGFRIAMVDLCSQICNLPRVSIDANSTEDAPPQNSDSHTFEDLRTHIMQDLNVTELKVLSKLIPNLADVVGADVLQDDNSLHNDDNSVVSSPSTSHSEPYSQQPRAVTRSISQKRQESHQRQAHGFKQQSSRLKIVLRRFIRIVCNYRPLVFVSDDIQWADKESLAMIESWMLDTSISSLMVIVCFRSNFVNLEGGGAVPGTDDSQTVSTSANLVGQMLSSIEAKKRERSIRCIKLEVDNLTMLDVHEMLKRLLGLYDDACNTSTSASASYRSLLNTSLHGNKPSTNTDSEGLVEIIFKKTNGNIFFLQQFIRMLVRRKLLRYDISRMRWVWDNDQISRETPATINVAELMELKLQEIDSARYTLPLAACLGSTFSWMLLRTTLEGFAEETRGNHRTFYESLFGGPPPSTEAELIAMMQTYRHEGLVESHTRIHEATHDHTPRPHDGSSAKSSAPSTYSFIHDKVQEAALAMIPSAMKLQELQHRIGDILMTRLSPDHLKESLFIVANLLNSRLDLIPSYPPTPSQDEAGAARDIIMKSKRFRAAKLNFDAGLRAIARAAFRQAFQYLETTISIMPTDHWESHYDMSLELYTSATECAFASDNFEKMTEYGNKVISLQNRPTIDKMRVYHILLDGQTAKIGKRKNSELIKFGADVLASFGFRYPSNDAVIALSLFTRMAKLKRSAKKWTIEYLNSIPPAKDPMEEHIMRMLDKHCTMVCLAKPRVYPLVMLDMVHRSMTKGTTSYTSKAMVNVAMMLGPISGDMQTAEKYANYALELCRLNETKIASISSIYMAKGYVLHNVSPFEDSKQAMLDTYSLSMSAGDVVVALWGMLCYLEMCFFTAKPLQTLEADYLTHVRAAEDFRQQGLAIMLAARWQMIMNLRGRSEHRTLLLGDAFDEVAIIRLAEQTGASVLKMVVSRAKMFLSIYFADFECAARCAKYLSKSQTMPGFVATIPVQFCTSFAATIVCSQHQDGMPRSEHNKMKQMARESYKALKTAREKGNPNTVHYLAILDAERAALRAHSAIVVTAGKEAGTAVGKKTSAAFLRAAKQYQDAIRACARTGMIQDQALGNERLAEHMLIANDRDGAQYHFDQAIRLCEEWGAHGKVAQLQERCATIWKHADEIVLQL